MWRRLCSFWIIIAARVDSSACDGELESTYDFSDLYEDGVAPPWPEDFGDRLSVIKFNFDEVALHPSQFGFGKHIPTIRAMIEEKYVDKVIPDAGLAVALYDIVDIRDAYIFPGDLKDSQGDAACTVVFRLVVFRPRSNELLTGRVLASTPMGLQVTLGFFQDLTIPASHLREPCKYDEKQNVWVWEYEDEKGKTVQYPYLPDQPICVRVTSVQFTDSVDSSLNASRRAKAMASTHKVAKPSTSSAHAHVPQEEPPMLVVASVQEDGLGLLAWWI